METMFIRIALCSTIVDERLKKKYGSEFVVNVSDIKVKLQNMLGAEYALVVHDRDKTLNKPHLHLVVKAPHEIICLLKELFPIGYCSSCLSYDACLLYLLHRGHKDKEQYHLSDLFTNIDYVERFPFLKEV